MNWGVQVQGYQSDTEMTCWRCLQESVPEQDDHIGLCDRCIASLRNVDTALLSPQLPSNDIDQAGRHEVGRSCRASIHD